MNLRKLPGYLFYWSCSLCHSALSIKHFVLIRHIFHTPPGMTSYYAEVGSAQRSRQPGTSSFRASQSFPHPRSSQGPGTKSKESLLSRTKLFNAVISCIFFIPSPHLQFETWWRKNKYDALFCILTRGPRISSSFTVVEDSSAATRKTFSDS